MIYYAVNVSPQELKHWGTKGMRWGRRRYQNPDGSLTEEGRRRYGSGSGSNSRTNSNSNNQQSSSRSNSSTQNTSSSNNQQSGNTSQTIRVAVDEAKVNSKKKSERDRTTKFRQKQGDLKSEIESQRRAAANRVQFYGGKKVASYYLPKEYAKKRKENRIKTITGSMGLGAATALATSLVPIPGMASIGAVTGFLAATATKSIGDRKLKKLNEEEKLASMFLDEIGVTVEKVDSSMLGNFVNSNDAASYKSNEDYYRNYLNR